MKIVFNNAHTKFYDKLNQKKDYGLEVSKIFKILNQYDQKGKNLLDLGCGSGNHIACFLENNFFVSGVDISAKMIEHARLKLANFIPKRLNLEVCNILDYKYLESKFNVVTCLYSVLGYVHNINDIQFIFNNILKCLLPGGVFILDLWNGEIVERIGPSKRTKEFKVEEDIYKRLSQPKINKTKQTIEVEFTYFINNEEIEGSKETHLVKYFFEEEIQNCALSAGFKSCEKIIHPNPLAFDNNGWNAMYILEKSK